MELNVKAIMGKPVVSIPDCIIKGWVKSVFIDLIPKKICGYEYVERNPLMIARKLAVCKDIVACSHCIMVNRVTEDTGLKALCKEKFIPFAIRASKDADDFGFVTDIIFDGSTGGIHALEISTGLLEDLRDGRKYYASFTVDMMDKKRIVIN